MSFHEYVQRTIETGVANPHWRRGQTAFNVLHEVRPDLSEQVRSGPLDPFYLDERLPEFHEWVEANW